jgi:hypothetical protein
MTAQWTRAHREQLWQLIEAGDRGINPGDLIGKSHEKDLRLSGYAVRNPRGYCFATPKGERALRDGLVRS